MANTRTANMQHTHTAAREKIYTARLNDYTYERELEYITKLYENYGNIEVYAVFCDYPDECGTLRQLIRVASFFEIEECWSKFSNITVARMGLEQVLENFQNEAY